jgi:uncharacterized membrane protein
MNVPWMRRLRGAAVIIAVAAPPLGHIALGLGRGYGAALAFAVLQAVAVGLILAASLRRRRWVGGLVALVLLGALGLGARDGAAVGLLTMAGAAHALLYSGLLFVFGRTLLPGRVALVTWVASRLNPTFHAGMVPYTRRVTLGWVLVFTGELVASGVLVGTNVEVWRVFVTALHVVPVIAMAVGEAVVRRWRWRHEHSTSMMETIRGTRRLMRGL